MSLSTTLAEARQLYQLLSEVERQLDGVDAKAKQATVSYADLYNVMQDVFVILKELGLPEDVVSAITLLQRLITTTYSLIIAMNALMLSTGGAGHLVIAGLGVSTSLISLAGSVG